MITALVKKYFVAFFILFLTVTPFVSHAQANEVTTYQTSYSNTIPGHPDIPDTMHNRIQVTILETMATALCHLTGKNVLSSEKPCLGINLENNTIGYVQPTDDKKIGGLLGQVSTMIGGVYNIPVHTDDYTRYVASNFGLTKTAYAQSNEGFDSLKPLLGLWRQLRDFSYLAFVIVFVLIGLGIMLRVKIDPRTVMNIQNQIPRIIISILLITFSYAIAGILVDAMWLSTYVGINLITPQAQCADTAALTRNATNNLLVHPLSYVSNLLNTQGCPTALWGFTKLAHNVGQTVGDMISSLVGSLFVTSVGQCTSWTGIDVGACVQLAMNFLFSGIVGIVATLIIAIAILVQLFRVWFSLLKMYIYVVIYTILGPIWILLGLLPGTTNFGFEQWLRHMVSGLAPFPGTIFLLLAAVVLANDPTINSNVVTNYFMPPLVGNPNASANFGQLISLGVILISPEIVNMMRNAFKVSSSKYVPQIMAGAAVGAAAAGAPLGSVWGKLNARNQAGVATGALSYYKDLAVGTLMRNTGILSKPWMRQSASKYHMVQPTQDVNVGGSPTIASSTTTQSPTPSNDTSAGTSGNS